MDSPVLKRITHRIETEEEIRHSEELRDSFSRVLYLKLLEGDLEKEVFTVYDDKGKIKVETIKENGIESSKTEYEYDNEERIVSQRLVIANELYEEIQTTYQDKGLVQITIQNGEEVEKLLQTKNGKDFTNLFYFQNELIERQEYIFNLFDNTSIQKDWDEKGHLIYRTETKYDEKGDILTEKIFNDKNNLMKEVKFELNNDLLVKEVHRDFINRDMALIYSHKYDSHRNLVHSECRDPEGNLLEFHNKEYDSYNRVVEEKGFSTGSFNAIYGTQVNGKDFHFIHRYEKIT
ncbi:hypothetical protein [Roseivirga misakiensis]|uniref:Uncharacterized protein n=1 Tax=Roseivirga misakiensis TaxID=1563681 RepID=A0A1E5SYR0_9BACT|nr:hypothetical protein [Roseivirga misakiensis]OEK04242.1 hypothetical protein BFP71_12215 [Roseivirga misakiensis]